MTEQTRKRHLAKLRKECIDGTEDLVVKRVAYAMETAIRRVTERTVGWPSLVEEARATAQLLREEMA